jgi:hypothetical protein
VVQTVGNYVIETWPRNNNLPFSNHMLTGKMWLKKMSRKKNYQIKQLLQRTASFKTNVLFLNLFLYKRHNLTILTSPNLTWLNLT